MQWFNEHFEFEGETFNADQVIETLLPRVTADRRDKLLRVVARRDGGVVSVMERIYDRGNISAVMRSAEAFGFYRMHVIENPGERFKEANRVTAGTEKWVNLETFKEPEPCFKRLKSEGYSILVSDLKAPEGIEHIDGDRKWAIVFGNEKEGISDYARAQADEFYKIPMLGFAESFNISVAAALTFQFMNRIRAQQKQDFGPADPNQMTAEQRQILANYLVRTVSHSHLILKRLN